MTALIPVDRVEVQILVDNVTDGLSTVPSFVESEMAYHWRLGMKAMAGSCLCCAAHGLSCLVTAFRGATRRTLLFDTGPDVDVFRRNVTLLKADLTTVDAIVLSHGHWDHAGAMPAALDMIRGDGRGAPIPVHMHPGMFRSRAMRAPNGAMRPFADIPSVDELTVHGAKVVLAEQPEVILDDMFQISGEIPRVVPFELGMPGQFCRTHDGQGWEPDPLLMDERSVAVHVVGQGLIIFSACSHAGIVNVLSHARTHFPGIPMHCVMGGFHLSGENEAIIPETVTTMKQFDIAVIAAGHCTGWRAVTALANTFGPDVLAPLAVGKRFSFGAAA